MKLSEIIAPIEELAPLAYQESYDNAGLLIGHASMEVRAVLLCIDVTEAVIDEALSLNANLIIAHHPLIFSGLKKITGYTSTERMVIKAIKNDIAVYAAHTNLDSVTGGVNSKICEKLGLKKCRILAPATGELRKLVTFVPKDQAEKVRMAIFEAGAGKIGEYDQCSYNVEGHGTFRGSENTNPFVGEQGKLHVEEETRIETIFPGIYQAKVINALLKVHPYEEVAYDVYPLENSYEKVGIGMVGELDTPEEEDVFLAALKDIFKIPVIRHSVLLGKPIQRVAVCGGSGSFLIQKAISANADIFLTGDMKYHQFFEADNEIIIADIGHYESEQFTKEIFYDLLTKKFPKFAVHLSKIVSNPINYL